jgi:hypothetical protein
MHFTITAEIDATEMFADEGPDWRFCEEHATFIHVDACEYVIHCADEAYAEGKAQEMEAAGCSAEFIRAYRDAARSGALRVIFYA